MKDAAASLEKRKDKQIIRTVARVNILTLFHPSSPFFMKNEMMNHATCRIPSGNRKRARGMVHGWAVTYPSLEGMSFPINLGIS